MPFTTVPTGVGHLHVELQVGDSRLFTPLTLFMIVDLKHYSSWDLPC